ncbi:MAG: hypothetical protein WC799_23770 [Desulfobacteraceae bacterium]|jgi:CMP-N-acetylneuraminic acid synthetase
MAKDLGKLKVIALLQARGRGSTLPEKNMYRLNSEPMIAHFLNEIKKADFIDGIGVWTECDAIADVVKSCGCQALKRPRGMVHYGSGFYAPDAWHQCIEQEAEKVFGPPPYVRVWLNCNHVLFSFTSLETMFRLFVEDDEADIIFPVCRIESDLHVINPETSSLFPVLFKTAHLNETRSVLYRKVGMHISVSGSGAEKQKLREIHFEVPWYEGRDIQEFEDTFFAEYLLKKRAKKRGGL